MERMKHYRNAVGFCILLVLLSYQIASAETTFRSFDIAPDQPGEDDALNEELWEFARKTPYKEALQHIALMRHTSRSTMPREAVLPTGWKIAPAGTQVELGRFPQEAVPYADRIVVLNTGYYRNEPQEAWVVDPRSTRVIKVLRLPSIFPCALAGMDGDLYISGGDSRKVYRFNNAFEPVREYDAAGYVAGLAAMDASHLALVYMVASKSPQEFERGEYGKGRVAVLDTTTGKVEREADAGYFPYSVLYVNGKLYVTLLGEDKLKVYSPALDLLKTLQVGKAPQDLRADGNQLYVVNTGSDSLSVVDAQRDEVSSTLEIHRGGSSFGSAPISCAIEGGRLYVAQAGANCVALFDTRSEKLLGYIPTGWYPTKVALYKEWVLVLSGKGIHARRPNPNGPQPVADKGGSQYVLTLLKGALSIIPKAGLYSKLPAWTRQVEEGSPIYSPRQGFKLPIKHVFYIIRENRTYDQVLGDLDRGNGDPHLTLFGRELTPNAHRLAEQFVTLDNFYANGEMSVLGHSFTTSGYASPFLEWLGNAAYCKRYTGYPFGMVPATTSPVYLWDLLEQKGIDYRIYGEDYYVYTRAYRIICDVLGQESELAHKFYAQTMSLASKVERGNAFHALINPFHGLADSPGDALRLLEKPEFAQALSGYLCGDDTLLKALKESPVLRQLFAHYLARYPFTYRSWDLTVSDLERAKAWRDDFEKQLRSGKPARLHYIWLPNDHTGGSGNPKYLTPYQLVAQNDAALGIIVEAISHSPVWKESLILVVEDDAQNGPDHVDATRTVALAVGPYVKRGALVSDRFDQLSMLRTIEILLGLPSLNTSDALAAPMFSIFTDKPAPAPYSSLAASEHMTESDLELYKKLRQDAPLRF